MTNRELLAVHLDRNARILSRLFVRIGRDYGRRELRRRRNRHRLLCRRDRGYRSGSFEVSGQRFLEHLLRQLERHSVLRTLRARETRLHRQKIQLNGVAEHWIGSVVGAEDSLRLGVRFDELHLRLVPPRESQIVDRLGVDREETHRRPVLGRHVADGRSIGQRKARQSYAIKFHEFADDLFFAEHFRHGQHEISRSGTRLQAAVHLESDDLRDEHRYRLSEHCRLGFDSADAPAEYTKPVDHGGVGIGADQRVGVRVRHLAHDLRENSRRQILEIDLVHDPGVGRNDAKVVQRLLSPAQERVALLIAGELEISVDQQRGLGSVFIHLHRVIDDEIHRLKRVDQARVAAEARERVTHGGEIDDGGNSGEILEQHSRGAEGDLLFDFPLHVPGREGAHVVRFDELAVFVSEQVFEEDLEADGESACVPVRELGQGIQPKDRVLPTRNVQR